jgi:hypothetical protein
MLHTDYDRKRSVTKKKQKTLVVSLKGLGAKANASHKVAVPVTESFKPLRLEALGIAC